MFLPSELDRIMGLPYPDIRCATWSKRHFDYFQPNEFDAVNINLFDDYVAYLEKYMQPHLNFSVLGEHKVYAMFGLVKIRDTVYEAWLLPSATISEQKFRLHKASIQFFRYAMEKLSIKRLQIAVCTTNVSAYKWAKVCYFQEEGILRKYGLNGEDYYMMSKIA